eukprot:6033223-Prymnesium_polylepis.1
MCASFVFGWAVSPPARVLDRGVLLDVRARGFVRIVHIVPREVDVERLARVVRRQQAERLVGVEVARVRGARVTDRAEARRDVRAARVGEVVGRVAALLALRRRVADFLVREVLLGAAVVAEVPVEAAARRRIAVREEAEVPLRTHGAAVSPPVAC